MPSKRNTFTVADLEKDSRKDDWFPRPLKRLHPEFKKMLKHWVTHTLKKQLGGLVSMDTSKREWIEIYEEYVGVVVKYLTTFVPKDIPARRSL